MKQLMTIQELANVLRTTPQALRIRRHRGQAMPPVTKVGRRLLFDEGDGQRWLNEQKEMN